MLQDTHCTECGAAYLAQGGELKWPRECDECGSIRWKNPPPVVMIMQPIITELENGAYSVALAAARRAIEPGKGGVALFAGFVDFGESAEEGARREFLEETGLELAGPPRILFSRPTRGGPLLIAMFVEKAMPLEYWMTGRPCPENEELLTYRAESNYELCFPIHREAAKRFFEGEFKWRL